MKGAEYQEVLFCQVRCELWRATKHVICKTVSYLPLYRHEPVSTSLENVCLTECILWCYLHPAICTGLKRGRYFYLPPCTHFVPISELDLGFHYSIEKATAQIQRDAKEVHFELV